MTRLVGSWDIVILESRTFKVCIIPVIALLVHEDVQRQNVHLPAFTDPNAHRFDEFLFCSIGVARL